MIHLRRRRHRSGSDAADKQASARNTMVDGCFRRCDGKSYVGISMISTESSHLPPKKSAS